MSVATNLILLRGNAQQQFLARSTGKISISAIPSGPSGVISGFIKHTFAYDEHVLVRLDEFLCDLLNRYSRKCRLQRQNAKNRKRHVRIFFKIGNCDDLFLWIYLLGLHGLNREVF